MQEPNQPNSALGDCAGLCGVKIKQVDAQHPDEMEQYQVTPFVFAIIIHSMQHSEKGSKHSISHDL